jgi:hypothetical protein
MTREDIIRMAKEADLWLTSDERIAAVVRFANLVAAAEREKIISANAPEIERINEYIKSLEEAVAAEREACAQVCDEIANKPSNMVLGVALDCADAIRARSK